MKSAHEDILILPCSGDECRSGSSSRMILTVKTVCALVFFIVVRYPPSHLVLPCRVHVSRLFQGLVTLTAADWPTSLRAACRLPILLKVTKLAEDADIEVAPRGTITMRDLDNYKKLQGKQKGDVVKTYTKFLKVRLEMTFPGAP